MATRGAYTPDEEADASQNAELGENFDTDHVVMLVRKLGPSSDDKVR